MKSETSERYEKAMGEETYLIENLDECEGLLHPHPRKRVIFKLKYVAELSDVPLGVCVEFGEFFEHGDVWDSLLQGADKCGC